jgi:hypothetical protein
MALIDFTGFDTQTDNMYHSFFDYYYYANTYYDYDTGRFGTGRSITNNHYNCLMRKYFENIDELIVGFAYKRVTDDDYGFNLYVGNDDNTLQTTIMCKGSGKIIINRYNTNGTLLYDSTISLFNPMIWNYFEFKVGLHNTTGYTVVRINEIVVVNLTNVDNLYTGSDSRISNFTFGQAHDGRFDDLYACDNSGTTNNDFLGDIAIDTLHPSANGTTNNGTASTGSAYECVDEVEVNADSDYVTLDAVNEIELYAIEDLPSTSFTKTIYGIKSVSTIRKVDSGARVVIPLVRINGTNYEHSMDDAGLSSDYNEVVAVWETNPDDAAAFVEADVNAIESGIKITA